MDDKNRNEGLKEEMSMDEARALFEASSTKNIFERFKKNREEGKYEPALTGNNDLDEMITIFYNSFIGVEGGEVAGHVANWLARSLASNGVEVLYLSPLKMGINSRDSLYERMKQLYELTGNQGRKKAFYIDSFQGINEHPMNICNMLLSFSNTFGSIVIAWGDNEKIGEELEIASDIHLVVTGTDEDLNLEVAKQRMGESWISGRFIYDEESGLHK